MGEPHFAIALFPQAAVHLLLADKFIQAIVGVVVANDKELANVVGNARASRGRGLVDFNRFLSVARAANAQRRITIDTGQAAQLFQRQQRTR